VRLDEIDFHFPLCAPHCRNSAASAIAATLVDIRPKASGQSLSDNIMIGIEGQSDRDFAAMVFAELDRWGR
jgi:hypothetical protein